MRHKKNPESSVIIRPLPPGDPRDLAHPCHKEQWLTFAETIGEMLADIDFARDQKVPQ